MKDGWILIRWTDFSKTNETAKTCKTLADIKSALHFFSQKGTAEILEQIVHQLNSNWNKLYAEKSVII